MRKKDKAPRCRGAVTVFLLIVFLALMLLAGVIIDAVRIMTAQAHIQNALDTAVRSNLAGYSPELAGEFGLFASAADKEETRRYFEVNLKERHQGFRFIDYEITRFSTDNHRVQNSLLNDKELEKQVLEYMKYKGPLVLGEELKAFMEEAFWEKTDSFGAGQKIVCKELALKKTVSELDGKLADFSTAFIAGQLDKIESEAVAQTAAQMEENKRILQTKLGDMKKEYLDALCDYNWLTGENLEENPPEITELQQQIAANIRIIEHNAGLLREIEALQKECEETEKMGHTLSPDAIAARILKIREEINRKQGDLLEPVPLTFGKPTPTALIAKELLDKMEEIQKKLASWTLPLAKDSLITAQDITEANEKELPAQEGTTPYILRDKGHYVMSDDYVEEDGNNVASFLAKIGAKLEEVLTDEGSSILLMQYIMDKFAFVTSPTARNHYFSRGEVEYIICGHESQADNLADVFGRIWFLRFAINSLHNFIKNPAPEMMARISSALAKGFGDSCLEMGALYRGEAIPGIPGLNIPLHYSHHLQLLLLLQDKEVQLNRTKQLIQVNMKEILKCDDLKNYHVTCQAETEVAINLWFLPFLNLERMGAESFKNGKYLITCSAAAAY